MPPYESLQIEDLWWVYGIGTAIALFIVLVRGAARSSFTLHARSEEQLQEEVHEFGGGVTETNRPMPIFFWVVLVAFLIWALGYVLLKGGALI
jgi:hypothetical protein